MQVASRDLGILVKAGYLLPKGEKRGRLYMASPRLVEIRDRNREPKIPAAVTFKEQLDFGF